jgi:25S rRNA (adenine2142-N1)-methyltransferase
MAPSRKPSSLKSGRPPLQKKPASISSKATQKLIIAYHALQKDLAKATASNDHAKAASLQAEIDALGGLRAYQRASIQGQSISRGGDSSLPQ